MSLFAFCLKKKPIPETASIRHTQGLLFPPERALGPDTQTYLDDFASFAPRYPICSSLHDTRA
jgi:hypothetical protein